MSGRTDLTSYLLGERSELRALIEAISRAKEDSARQRAAVEYLLVLAAARMAASGHAPEAKALAQVHSQYMKIFACDESEHALLISELYSALTSGRGVSVIAALKLLGLYHRKQGTYQLARASFAVSSELARQIGDPLEELNTLFWLGVAERYLGHLDRAESVHREQLTLAREQRNHAQAVLAQENLGLVALRRGRVAEARKRVSAALHEAQQLEDEELQAYCHHALMTVEIYAGRPGEAAASGWEAYRRYESDEQRLRALQECAVIMFDSGLFDAAEAAWEIVLQQSEDFALTIHCRIGMVDVAARQGQEERFEKLAAELLGESGLEGMPFEQLEALRSVGLGYAAFRNFERSRVDLMKSLALADENGFEAQAAAIRESLAELAGGALRFEPMGVTESEFARLEDVSRNIKAERARRCA